MGSLILHRSRAQTKILLFSLSLNGTVGWVGGGRMTDRLWRRVWGILFCTGSSGRSCLSHENNERWILIWAVSVLKQRRE